MTTQTETHADRQADETGDADPHLGTPAHAVIRRVGEPLHCQPVRACLVAGQPCGGPIVTSTDTTD
ncbi:hypothetical protein PQR57_17135 [Paraburkholderia dipogonis]|uniref:Uncharacterized protein n=1 Tax=Paraburkholderia dipogonis TaxID=1211383 RepID=A0ABW9ATT5_9BURK